MELTENQIVRIIIAAYIQVYGETRWDSLTADQQHTVIMTLAKDMTKVVEQCDEA